MLFPSAEITGDVVVGERTIIGAGVKIIGDSHGPVRIGADVQILENTVLHLLPDNDLVLDDGVVIGPGAMIHGCRIGAGSVVEPGAIVCDHSVLGAGCVVRAGAVVKQRSEFAAGTEIDGFPAVEMGRVSGVPVRPAWAFASFARSADGWSSRTDSGDKCHTPVVGSVHVRRAGRRAADPSDGVVGARRREVIGAQRELRMRGARDHPSARRAGPDRSHDRCSRRVGADSAREAGDGAGARVVARDRRGRLRGWILG